MNPPVELFTIGYQGRDLAGFCRTLSDHGIDTLIDVRWNPFSRKKGFSGKPLREALEKEGIRYVHLRRMGTPPSLREKLKRDGDREAFHAAFSDHLSADPEGLAELTALISGERCCLMCFERAVEDCHRSRVSLALRNRMGETLLTRHL